MRGREWHLTVENQKPPSLLYSLPRTMGGVRKKCLGNWEEPLLLPKKCPIMWIFFKLQNKPYFAVWERSDLPRILYLGLAIEGHDLFNCEAFHAHLDRLPSKLPRGQTIFGFVVFHILFFLDANHSPQFRILTLVLFSVFEPFLIFLISFLPSIFYL